jgi:hypothetical protein
MPKKLTQIVRKPIDPELARRLQEGLDDVKKSMLVCMKCAFDFNRKDTPEKIQKARAKKKVCIMCGENFS